jgi:hypothetical protein
MKAKTRKKENKGCPAKLKRSGGFALLFSVLVSSLLLTIGLSILNISLKELSISTASKQSIYAYYAADSGRENALYIDLKEGSDFALDKTNHTTTTYIAGEDTNIFVDEEGDPSGPNFYVTTKKVWDNRVDVDPFTIVRTTINSVGHNSDGGDRVEREIQQIY